MVVRFFRVRKRKRERERERKREEDMYYRTHMFSYKVSKYIYKITQSTSCIFFFFSFFPFKSPDLNTSSYLNLILQTFLSLILNYFKLYLFNFVYFYDKLLTN